MERSWLIDELVILFKRYGRTNTSPLFLKEAYHPHVSPDTVYLT
jgi:hypothetical protein